MIVCVVGNYGNGDKLTDGQGIKTLELYNSLVKRFGQKEVYRVNLYKPNRIVIGCKLLLALIRCKNVIVLVSKNGRKTVIPLLVYMNKLFHRNIFHSLIGSTTHQTLDENHKYIDIYNAITGNWSETYTEKKLLEDRGLTNVTVVKNFKNIKVLDQGDLVYSSSAPFKICTFSRVEQLKGIGNIVRIVNRINENYGKCMCKLDIYGQVMERYKDEFEELKKDFGESIRYKGIVDFDKSVDIIKGYYLTVFPTLYYTEGIPGTILDSFAAGVPVLSSEWESCFDIMNDRVGITYSFNNDEALYEKLCYAIENPEVINAMKTECIKEAKKYSSDEVVLEIEKYFLR